VNRTTTALQPENELCSVARGEPIGLVVAPERVRIKLFVDERHIDRVATGQTAKLLISQISPEFMFGKVAQIAIDKTESAGRQTAATREQQTPPVGDSQIEVIIAPDAPTFDARYQSRVHAVLIGERQPLYLIVRRFIAENFDF
jgi:hypothetical protein